MHAGIGFLTPLGDKANRVLQTMKKRKEATALVIDYPAINTQSRKKII